MPRPSVCTEPCPQPGVARFAGIDSIVSPYDSAFAAAGAEFGVPASLLKAIGWVETRWQIVQG